MQKLRKTIFESIRSRGSGPRLALLPILLIVCLSGTIANASLTLDDEKKLGQEFYDKLLESGTIIQDPRISPYLQRLGEEVLTPGRRVPFDFKFSVIDSAAVNAFATPGGYVYVNRGLINLVDKESELAGVLAHEIAHVNQRHIADIIDKGKKINIAALAAVLAGAFLGAGSDLSGAAIGFSMAAATSLSLKYSREHEEEADRLGMSYMAAADYNPRAMLDFLKTMRRYEFYSSKIPSYFLTHPGTDERIRYLDGLTHTTYRMGGRDDHHGRLKRIQAILLVRGKVSDAVLRQHRENVRNHPQDADALFSLALLLDRTGQNSEAVECFRRALALAPDDEIRIYMGRSLMKSGLLDESIDLLKTAHERTTGDVLAMESLAQAYEAKGAFAEALPLYLELTRLDPDNPEFVYRMAMNYGRLGRVGEAHVHFGRYFKSKKKKDTALYHYREALKHFPSGSEPWNGIQREIDALKAS